ncbi:MAG: hypothetical protein AVDCRST_MAG08-3990, partial [uncultured Acetobacteraceae bacterium]
ESHHRRSSPGRRLGGGRGFRARPRSAEINHRPVSNRRRPTV